MTRLKVAHVREQGVDLIIVPLASSFGRQSTNQQHSAIHELETRAASAGLAGGIVPVWDSGSGRMAFIAPNEWHPFFRSINLRWVFANVNRELSW